METTKDSKLTSGRFLETVLPPRLEDAGLEDCALPPESIKEAFFKAASAVKSRASSLFITGDDEESEGPNCVNDPWPTAEDAKDVIVSGDGSPLPESDAVVVGGDWPVRDESGPCAVEKNGGVVEEGKDKVVVGGGGDVADVEEREGFCGTTGEKGKIGNGSEEGKSEKKPTLTEGFV